jgi:hypothetical protein
MPLANLAHAVPQLHAVVAANPLHRAAVDREDHGVSLRERHHRGSRLHARPVARSARTRPRRDSRRTGNDFHRGDLSINQWWPGYVAGECHNNHHLYPTSARSGFLPHQLDLAWCLIRVGAWLGGVTRCRDSRADFYRDHYRPYLDGCARSRAAEATTE